MILARLPADYGTVAALRVLVSGTWRTKTLAARTSRSKSSQPWAPRTRESLTADGAPAGMASIRVVSRMEGDAGAECRGGAERSTRESGGSFLYGADAGGGGEGVGSRPDRGEQGLDDPPPRTRPQDGADSARRRHCAGSFKFMRPDDFAWAPIDFPGVQYDDDACPAMACRPRRRLTSSAPSAEATSLLDAPDG